VNRHHQHIRTTVIAIAFALSAAVEPVASADPPPLQKIENQYAGHHKPHHTGQPTLSQSPRIWLGI
jgi:hypothetical protein